MAVAIPFAIRQQIVQIRALGKSYRQVSQELGVSYDLVRRICKRQHQQGEIGLIPRYKQCGITGIRLSAFHHRVSLWLKRTHPLWGAPYIGHNQTRRANFRHVSVPKQSGNLMAKCA